MAFRARKVSGAFEKRAPGLSPASLRFLTMLCSFALFVSSFGFNGPKNLNWRSGQLRYLLFI